MPHKKPVKENPSEFHIEEDQFKADQQDYTPLGEEEFQFLEHAFKGTGGFRTGEYILPHKREVFYKTRRELGFYRNFTRPILNAAVDPVFSEMIPRIVTPDSVLFSPFLENVDNRGTTMQRFMKRAAKQSRLHGVTFIVVDNFTKDEIPDNIKQAQDSRKFPYVYLKSKNDVADFILDKWGNIEVIYLFDKMVKMEGKPESHYLRWDAETVTEVKRDKKDPKMWIEISEPIIHGLEIVPVHPMYSVDRDNEGSLIVPSPMFDLAKMNWTLYNIDSELRELERNQGFSILYVQTDNPSFAIGTSNFIKLGKEVKMAPGFVSPDAKIPETLMKRAGEILNSLFQIAEQNGVVAVKEQQSGIAKEWDFQAHGFVLKETARISEETEIWISEVFKLYTNETFIYEVKYRSDFQPRATLGQIQIFQGVIDAGISGKGRALALKEMVLSAFHDKKMEELQPILDEIDAGATDEMQDLINEIARLKEEAEALKTGSEENAGGA